jgi:Bacterial regulatory proteins, luxR family
MLQLIAEGRSNKEVANILNISVKPIRQGDRIGRAPSQVPVGASGAIQSEHKYDKGAQVGWWKRYA